MRIEIGLHRVVSQVRWRSLAHISSLIGCLSALLPSRAESQADQTLTTCLPGKPAKEAIEDCTKILALPNLDTPTRVSALLVRGDAYGAINEPVLASKDYEDAQKISYSPNVSIALGATYINLGKSSEAIAEFTKVIDAGLATAQVFNARGAAFQNAGEFDKSIADFDKALFLQPNFLMALNNKAAAYAKKGDNAEALKVIDTLLAENPNMPLALVNRCGLLARDGRMEQGRASCDKAEHLSDDYFTLLGIGGAYYDAGKFNRAVEYFSKSLRQLPNNARALYSRGMAEAKLGKTEESIADISAAERIQPDIAAFMAKLGMKK
jgi:tetratricopeptide (TPR) repeat protein